MNTFYDLIILAKLTTPDKSSYKINNNSNYCCSDLNFEATQKLRVTQVAVKFPILKTKRRHSPKVAQFESIGVNVFAVVRQLHAAADGYSRYRIPFSFSIDAKTRIVRIKCHLGTLTGRLRLLFTLNLFLQTI